MSKMNDSTETFIHPLADVGAAEIGASTRVWQFAAVLAGARIGSNCNICAHTLVEGGMIIGDRVTMKSGVYVWDGIVLEDDVFLGPNCVFTNDRYPRSHHRKPYPITTVRRGASIGAGAVILPGLEIGEDAMIGAGAIVTRFVPPAETWFGNPARNAKDGPVS